MSLYVTEKEDMYKADDSLCIASSLKVHLPLTYFILIISVLEVPISITSVLRAPELQW